jgi:hypothetical protein
MYLIQYTESMGRIVGSGVQFITGNVPDSWGAIELDVWRKIILPLLNQRLEAITVRTAIGKIFRNLDSVPITTF